MNDLATRFAKAKALAADGSDEHQCTMHVNAVVDVVDGLPQITSFRVEDWYGGDTVATFTNGREG